MRVEREKPVYYLLYNVFLILKSNDDDDVEGMKQKKKVLSKQNVS